MLGFGTVCAYLLQALDSLTLSPFHGHQGSFQFPIGGHGSRPEAAVPTRKPNYPSFPPPNAPETQPFTCEYPEMTDYEFCGTHTDRGCWLKPKKGKHGITYNISTDYENHTPKGIVRRYWLDVEAMTLTPDGCENKHCKVFNATYPGPWIEACWGDEIEVTVTNHLDCNGTTIHWHGIRQLFNVEDDGVNGVTQCPIAPGDSYTYKFRAQQYGTTWYHSHYSLQYADGMAGPLVIHGPSSGTYDHAIDPILMTDWNQRSAFEDWAWALEHPGTRPRMTSVLLNGAGKYVRNTSRRECVDGKEPKDVKLHTLMFQKGVRYLLRLINTSVDTAFVFSIDGHELTVIQSDFVPIEPYTNKSLLIGIGQRYNVIVHAEPNQAAPNAAYWIRTVPATGCSSFSGDVSNTTGIVRYDYGSTADPESKQHNFDIKCSDETYSSLKPIHKWEVPKDTFKPAKDSIEVKLVVTNPDPYYPTNYVRFEMHRAPLWLNFSNPTVLDDFAISRNPPNYTAELILDTSPPHSSKEDHKWIELLITAPSKVNSSFFPHVAHPIHLHGHDFALLAQSEEPYDEKTAVLKRNNPPRRDVALLPAGGYLIIAFKADNPGVWLMHCHIAWHASSGLAMQILENTAHMKLPKKDALEETCRKWEGWFDGERTKSCQTWHPFQDDSGI